MADHIPDRDMPACLPACQLADNLKSNAFRLRRSAEPLPNGLADLRNRDALDLE